MTTEEINALKNKKNKLTPKAPAQKQIYTIVRKPEQTYQITIPVYIKNSGEKNTQN